MIISERQIMQLMSIAHAYVVIVFRLGGQEREMQDIQELLENINNQQSDKLKVIE